MSRSLTLALLLPFRTARKRRFVWLLRAAVQSGLWRRHDLKVSWVRRVPVAHSYTVCGTPDYIAPEIIQQAASAGLNIDGFVDFVGSGGTFGGVAAALQDHAKSEGRDAPPCFIVEPTNAAVLAEEAGIVPSSGTGDHSVQGGGYSFAAQDLPMISRDGSAPGTTAEIAGYIQVSDTEATETARLLASKEGLFCGFSAGANVAAAAELLRGECRGGTVAAVLCDSGLKYLSTTLWATSARRRKTGTGSGPRVSTRRITIAARPPSNHSTMSSMSSRWALDGPQGISSRSQP